MSQVSVDVELDIGDLESGARMRVRTLQLQPVLVTIKLAAIRVRVPAGVLGASAWGASSIHT